MDTLFSLILAGCLFTGGILCLMNMDKTAKKVVKEQPEPTPEKVPDISEPVISFLRIVKENPRRFSCKRDAKFESRSLYVRFKDKKEGKSWLVCRFTDYMGFSGDLCSYHNFPEWVTEDEKEYIWSELSKIFTSDRRERLHHLKRERMKRIYN